MKEKRKPFSKKMDEFLGIPLLFALGGLAPARKNSMPENISRIAFLRMDSVRDALYAEPAVNAFKNKYPGAEIVFFAGESNKGIVSFMKGVDETVEIFPGNLRKSVKVVRSKGFFDLWIDTGIWTRFEAILTFFAKAAFKTGFRADAQNRHFAYDKITDYSFDLPRSENIARLTALSGIKTEGSPRLSRTRRADGKTVILHIFPEEWRNSSAWNAENWKNLALSLTAKGYKPAITGSKKYSAEAEKFMEDAGPEADIDYLVGRLDPQGFMDALSSSALTVAGDDEGFHVGAALGVNVLGLFGPTSPELFAPKGKNVFALSGEGCSGCRNRWGNEKCFMGKPSCLDSISLQKAEEMIFNILEGAK